MRRLNHHNGLFLPRPFAYKLMQRCQMPVQGIDSFTAECHHSITLHALPINAQAFVGPPPPLIFIELLAARRAGHPRKPPLPTKSK